MNPPPPRMHKTAFFANHFEIKAHGKAAHAGMAPENGINALWIASRAIAKLNPGRVDAETTYNIGIMML